MISKKLKLYSFCTHTIEGDDQSEWVLLSAKVYKLFCCGDEVPLTKKVSRIWSDPIHNWLSAPVLKEQHHNSSSSKVKTKSQNSNKSTLIKSIQFN